MRSGEALIDPAQGRVQGRHALAAAHERFLWPAIAGLSAFAIFLLGRPYLGIVHDAVIYIGRAVADGDPDGLGRDLLFAHDGQAKFSLFTLLLRQLVGWFGPSTASMLVVAFSLPVWFGALAALASRLAKGRTLWAMLIFAAILPATYGGYGVFRFAEQYAVPRPLAEAGVLAALAALATGRNWIALGLLTLAGLLHPIMAAPGFGIWVCVVALSDRRWLKSRGLLVVAGMAAAGLAGFWFTGRIAVMDPAWRAAVESNVYLFPTMWPLEAWAPPIVQAVTVGMAAKLVRDGRARLVLISVLVTAFAGLLLAMIGGDWLSLLLVMQAQPWRAAWPLAVLGAACLPITLLGLWGSGRIGRVALASLSFAWLSSTSPVMAIAGAAAAAAILATRERWEAKITDLVVRATLLAVVAFGLLAWAFRAKFGFEVWVEAPKGESYLFGLSVLQIYTAPVAGAVILWVISGRPRPGPVLAGTGALALAGLAFLAIDDRGAMVRRMDAWRPDPALLRLLPDDDGEILWIRRGALRPWTIAGRRNWVSSFQAASIVFSRDQAALWTARMGRLSVAELADIGDRAPFRHPGPPRRLSPSSGDIARFCGAPDAPVAVMIPLDGTFDLPSDLPFRRYRHPVPEFTLGEESGRVVWRAAADYAIVGCSKPLREAELRG